MFLRNFDEAGGRSALKGVAPTQAWIATEIPIRREEFVARLDRQRGKIGVGHMIAASRGLPAELYENIPMIGSWDDGHTMRRRPDLLNEIKGRLQGNGRIKNGRVRRHAEKPAQHNVRHGIRLIASQDFSKPRLVLLVTGSPFPEGIDQDINVREDQ